MWASPRTPRRASLSICENRFDDSTLPVSAPCSSSTAVSTTTTGGLLCTMNSAQLELEDICVTPKRRMQLFDPGRVRVCSASSALHCALTCAVRLCCELQILLQERLLTESGVPRIRGAAAGISDAVTITTAAAGAMWARRARELAVLTCELLAFAGRTHLWAEHLRCGAQRGIYNV